MVSLMALRFCHEETQKSKHADRNFLSETQKESFLSLLLLFTFCSLSHTHMHMHTHARPRLCFGDIQGVGCKCLKLPR